MNKLLLDEHPLIVLPSLANKIGLNEAIFLQQLHYWTKESKKVVDGRKWTYNSYEDWKEQFPFWSVSTIKRTITSMKKQNLIHIGNYNKMKADKTNWYAINYETLFNMNQPSGQNEPMEGSDRTDGLGQNEQSNTLDFSETSSEKKEEEEDSPDPMLDLLIKNEIVHPNGINYTLQQDLQDVIDNFGFQEPEIMIQEAVKDAARGNGHTWKFVYNKLDRWRKFGYKTVQDVEDAKERYYGKSKGRNEQQGFSGSDEKSSANGKPESNIKKKW